jgi:hypothetical protein
MGLVVSLAVIAVALGAVRDAGAIVLYRAEGGWHFGSSQGFDLKEQTTPQTVFFGDFSYGGALCPAPGTANFLCAHVFSKADVVGGRRLTLHAEARLKRTNANGLTSQELVYAGAQVFIAHIGTATPSPVGYAYINLGMTGTRSQSASHGSLVPEAYATVRVNGVVMQCSADSCPRAQVPGWDGQYLTLTLRSDARVTNPQPGVITGWDAEMIADFSDTLELLAIELHDVDDQPIPGAELWVEDGQGNRLFDIPTSLESTTSTSTTSSTTSSTLLGSTSTTSTSVTSTTLQPALDHFRCYPGKTAKGTPKFESRTVRLVDDFEDKSTVVSAVASLCNPADKQGEGIADATAHLACYKIADAKGQPKLSPAEVVTSDQFGSLALRLSAAAALCVPSEKDGEPSALALDHFKCYRAKVPKGAARFVERTVVVTDQFETKTMTVAKPVAVCAAVDKNGEGVRRPSDRLVCYATKDAKRQPAFPGRTVQVHNQFGDLVLRVKASKTLCVPASLALP